MSLEESLSISTGLATRPSRLAPKKCINKSIWLATGGHLPWVMDKFSSSVWMTILIYATFALELILKVLVGKFLGRLSERPGS